MVTDVWNVIVVNTTAGRDQQELRSVILSDKILFVSVQVDDTDTLSTLSSNDFCTFTLAVLQRGTYLFTYLDT